MKPPAALRDCAAPAKLNLYLHVTGRRPDGYHEIETVFELIDLADTLHFRRRDDGSVVRVNPLADVPADADLTVRAARRLAEASGCRLGVEIEIDKRIPMGGGLGGGSSDAATTLLALNRLWALNWPAERLAALALELGADVPVFIHGQSAYATGVGELLQPLALPRRHYVVVAPRISVPTAAIFAAEGLTRDTEPMKIAGLSRGNDVFRGRNDLQSVVVARYPQVAAALEALQRAASETGYSGRLARMTGSGACVFLPLDSAFAANEVRRRLIDTTDAAVTVAASMARHPLRDWAFRASAVSHGSPSAD